MIKFEYIVKKEKLLNTTSLMKRIFKLSVWLKKRYNLKYKEATFEYYFQEGQKQINLITIKITFHE